LQTDGNFTAKAGDIYRMSDLFKASAPAGQTIAGFRVALGGVASGGGKLQLNGTDIVPARTSFSADEFAHLTYIGGPGADGLSLHQSLKVVAQTKTLATDGTISQGKELNADAAGEIHRMGDLFSASAPTGQAIVGYQVALQVRQGRIRAWGPWSASLRLSGNLHVGKGSHRSLALHPIPLPRSQTPAGSAGPRQ
jgi:hypothetical protein